MKTKRDLLLCWRKGLEEMKNHLKYCFHAKIH